MKRRIVLHIGLSKTGTTSIQRFLTKHRDALADRGTLYPDVSGMGTADPRLAPSVLKPSAARDPSHIALALELTRSRSDRFDGDIDTPLWSAVFRQIDEKGADTTIISYENFYMRPEHYSFDLVKERLQDFDVIGIIYLRPLESWIVSLYCQLVKGVKRLDAKFSFYSKAYTASLRYSHLIDSILANIPLDSLSIGDFNAAANEDLIRDFLVRSGAALDGINWDEPSATSNISLPSWATLFLLRCNRQGLPDDAFVETRAALSRSARRHAGPCLRPGLDVATPEERQRLHDLASADEDRLWQRHGVKLSQKAPERIEYRPFDDEDFRSIKEAIGTRISSVTRSKLDRV